VGDGQGGGTLHEDGQAQEDGRRCHVLPGKAKGRTKVSHFRARAKGEGKVVNCATRSKGGRKCWTTRSTVTSLWNQWLNAWWETRTSREIVGFSNCQFPTWRWSAGWSSRLRRLQLPLSVLLDLSPSCWGLNATRHNLKTLRDRAESARCARRVRHLPCVI